MPRQPACESAFRRAPSDPIGRNGRKPPRLRTCRDATTVEVGEDRLTIHLNGVPPIGIAYGEVGLKDSGLSRVGGTSGTISPRVLGHGRFAVCPWQSAEGPKRGVDLAGQQVQVGVAWICGIEGVEAKVLPPRPRRLIDRAHDDSSTRGSSVEIDGGRQDVGDQGRPDAEPGVGSIDGESADQQGGHRIRGVLGHRRRRGSAIDAGHGEAHIRDNHRVRRGDHPRRSGVPPTVLGRVPPEPLVEIRCAGIEGRAFVELGIQQLRAAELSQPTGTSGTARAQTRDVGSPSPARRVPR